MTHDSYPTVPPDQLPAMEQSDATYVFAPAAHKYSEQFGIELRPDGAEFQIGTVLYDYLGKNTDGYMQFASTTADGTRRPFVVYVSKSEGSYRASQGLETYQDEAGEDKVRLMKGPELSSRRQYTQDTQLHPDFYEKVDRLEEIRELKGLRLGHTAEYDAKMAEWFFKDFDAQTETFPLGSRQLDDQLKELRAGHQSRGKIEEITGYDPQTQARQAEDAYMGKIEALNQTLEASGIMPDFSQLPTASEATQHPVLGNIIRDTYEKTVQGTAYQWVMAHDLQGRAWIDRIRFTHADPTPYGTDKQMVDSGILTSKPMDYKDQVDGLPNHLTSDMNKSYTDISKFLQQLAPVREYSKHYGSRDQYVTFASAA